MSTSDPTQTDPLGIVRRRLKEVEMYSQKAHQALEEAEAEIGRLSRTPARNQVARALYWGQYAGVNPGRLAELFCVPAPQLAEIAGPVLLNTTCRVCQGTFRLQVTSRADLKEHDLDVDRSWPVRRICPLCLAERARYLTELRRLPGQSLTQKHRDAYANYLQSPQWQERRTRALRRANNRCQLCNTEQKPLNAHHRTYENLGEERPADLIVLCRPCHAKHHDH